MILALYYLQINSFIKELLNCSGNKSKLKKGNQNESSNYPEKN